MADKRKLLKDADEAYSELIEAVAGLSDLELSRVWLGTWGAREILIHIAAWDREMIPALQRVGRGSPRTRPAPTTTPMPGTPASSRPGWAPMPRGSWPSWPPTTRPSWPRRRRCRRREFHARRWRGRSGIGHDHGALPEHAEQVRGWREEKARNA